MDLEFLKNNLKDPSLAENFCKQRLSNARKTALTLGSLLIFSLISVVYAFVQTVEIENARSNHKQNQEQLAQCKMETEKQKGLAQEAALMAEEALKETQRQLDDCLKQ